MPDQLLPSEDKERDSARDHAPDTGAATSKNAAPDVPHDRPFYAIDAYGEVQHVEWIGGEVGGPFGAYVGIIDSDGDCFPVSDIGDWSFDRTELEAQP